MAPGLLGPSDAPFSSQVLTEALAPCRSRDADTAGHSAAAADAYGAQGRRPQP